MVQSIHTNGWHGVRFGVKMNVGRQMGIREGNGKVSTALEQLNAGSITYHWTFAASSSGRSVFCIQ